MAQSSFQMPQWLYYFDTLPSTNNYAMQLIEDGMAQHGMVIWTKHQTQGKGQRGKLWMDHSGNLKFSLIVKPLKDGNLVSLGINVAVVLATYLKTMLPVSCQISIKWPNDLFINDKKTAGILIENSFRGMDWSYSVIGIGLNISQTNFHSELQHATSIELEGGPSLDHLETITDFRAGILNLLHHRNEQPKFLMEEYNQLLYKKDAYVHFKDKNTNEYFEALVLEVEASGKLLLLTSNGPKRFDFGSIEWILK